MRSGDVYWILLWTLVSSSTGFVTGPAFWRTTSRLVMAAPALESSALLQESPVGNEADQSSHKFDELCKQLGVEGVRLQTIDNVRGVYLDRPVSAGESILEIPLEACLRDDEPPAWFDCELATDEETSDDECLVAGYYNPSQWATRLAASLIDAQLQQRQGTLGDKATGLWLDLLPNPSFLRASLPIHWSPVILSSACCTALELAVDASFFARAQAMEDLLSAIDKSSASAYLPEQERRELCESALDMVQTRSCRVVLEREAWAPPTRLLAPVFDFINHQRPSNAEFVMVGDHLVVRTLRDLSAGEQVCIDYGESTQPAWKCLVSYGFVPAFHSNEVDSEEQLAEVYLDGVRYEVSPTMIPEDMVAAAILAGTVGLTDTTTTSPDKAMTADAVLTHSIAISLARRISDVAYQLLLDPLDRYDTDEEVAEAPQDVLSAQLAASLRWNQHRILLACSIGLRDWAVSGALEHKRANS